MRARSRRSCGSPSTRLEHELPVFWLVDSAGARLTDQVELFPGRRGAGRIFYNQNRLSGRVPQICCLFGPSAAGGAYIPAFCDVVIMVEGNASMYLGSPRMVEMVVGERTTLEEMGGARMHATVSGSGDNLAVDDADAIAQARGLLRVHARRAGATPLPTLRGRGAGAAAHRRRRATADESVAFDMHDLIDGVVDADSFFEVKPLFAPEVIVGLRAARGATDRHRRRATRCTRAARSSSTRPTRPPASSGAATRSGSRWCSWPTSPGSWSAPRSNARGSSATAPR